MNQSPTSPTSPKSPAVPRPPPTMNPVTNTEHKAPGANEQAAEETATSGNTSRSNSLVSQSGRVRKQVERFENLTQVSQQPKSLEIPTGTGTMLGKIPYIEDQLLSRFKGTDDTIKGLHRLMYPGCPVSKKDVKANLRLFHGFAPEQLTADERQKLVEKLQKWTVSGLKEACVLFGLEKGGDKGKIAERIVDFLRVPKDLGKLPESQKKAKKTAAKKKAAASKPAAGTKKKAPPKKKKSDSDDEDDEEDQDDMSDDLIEEEERVPEKSREDSTLAEDDEDDMPSESGSDDPSDDDFDPSAKKKQKKAKRSPKKAASPAPKKMRVDKVGTPQKTVVLKHQKASVLSKDVVDSSDSDEEDSKPLVVAKIAPSTPSEKELRSFIMKLLETSNLTELTKKKVRESCKSHFVDRHVSEDWWTTQKELINSCVDEGLKQLSA